MSRIRLPEGVPAENQNTSRQRYGGDAGVDKRGGFAPTASGSAGQEPSSTAYSAPDTATPIFLGNPESDSVRSSARTVREKHEVYERVVEDDEDETPSKDTGDEDDVITHGFHPPAPLLILIAIGLLLIALAAFVVSRNQETTPLCSELPAWNQYNCIPG
ncbi:MAG: hypothetical protein AAFW68_04395 [Pseudomonadota bacterium]